MVYVRFNTANGFHQETCGFQEWGASGLRACGARAVGYTGAKANKRTYLCKEHFNVAWQLDGLHETDIKTEKRINYK